MLQIPRSAILEESGETSVFVVEDDKAMRRDVVTGYSNAGMIEIVEGLEAGADDYLTKPFSMRELLARDDIDAVLIATGPNWHATAATMAAMRSRSKSSIPASTVARSPIAPSG